MALVSGRASSAKCRERERERERGRQREGEGEREGEESERERGSKVESLEALSSLNSHNKCAVFHGETSKHLDQTK